MRIQYCSDLHLEFPVNRDYLKINPIKTEGEILLLAGDVVPFHELDKHKEFFDFLSENFQHTYWVPGNHEYYRSDITQRTGAFHEHIRSNVSLLNNTTIHHDTVRLVFSTLWSNIDLAKEWAIKKFMADFRLITSRGNKIDVDNYNMLHRESVDFVTNEIQVNSPMKTIVVSHHLPTFLHYPEKYRYSELNTAFATELSDLIKTSAADYWIYGHSHEIIPDFKIGKTTLITNQLGYVERDEHHAYNNGKCLTI